MIETLQRNRSGAQDLLQMVANTVVRVDSLWLTSVTARANDSLDIEGEAGSINAVANFITELKRSGYFDKVEIKSAKENDFCSRVETYSFSMTRGHCSARRAARPRRSPQASTQPPPPAAKGRS